MSLTRANGRFVPRKAWDLTQLPSAMEFSVGRDRPLSL